MRVTFDASRYGETVRETVNVEAVPREGELFFWENRLGTAWRVQGVAWELDGPAGLKATVSLR